MNGLVPYLVNGGMAAVVAAAFMGGLIYPKRIIDDRDRQLAAKDQEIAEWKAAYAAERSRADASVLAAQTTSNVLAALHREVSQ